MASNGHENASGVNVSGTTDSFGNLNGLISPNLNVIPIGQVFAKSAIPFIIAPTGTMANNGAITLGTALPTTYANAYIYLPANAIQTSSAAGWYFAQMSSTTVGTVYQNTYSSGVPSIPASPTAFVSTGPGAFTGQTSTTITGVTFTIPANTIGPNGSIRILAYYSCTNSANVKTVYFTIGASSYLALATTSTAGGCTLREFSNRGAQNSQVSMNPGFATGLGAGALLLTTNDFSTSLTASYQFGVSNTATEYHIMDGFVLEAMQ